ncbi:MAG: elongation factor G [Ruminococcaceae bacterium]|nr:elongation factor G [Oscillospiraceae bacterium]
MKQYPANKIKNVVLAGHGGSGKTSLAEAMLWLSGAADRMGKTADGNTVCDFDPEEIKRKTSVSTAVAPLERNGLKINLLDAPGLFDYVGGVNEGYRAAETALIVVAAKDGVAVGSEKANKLALTTGRSRIFFINKLDTEGANFYKAYEALREAFGPSVCPVVVPYYEGDALKCYVDIIEGKAFTFANGKAAACDMPALDNLDELKDQLNEAIAETDEELMMKFFDGEAFTHDEIVKGLSMGIASGSIAPVYCGAALNAEAVELLLAGIEKYAPTPCDVAPEVSEEGTEIKVSESEPTAAILFKTVADAFVGKMSFFKVLAGKISSDSPLVNMRTGTNEKFGKLITVRGKKQEDTNCIPAGDIGAVTKLGNANTGDTFCDPGRQVTLKGVEYPNPLLSKAILPVKKGEEDKIASGISKLIDEDPSIKFVTNAETHQMVLSGQGDQHIDVIVSKLKSRFNVDVILETPRVPYRETIRKTVEQQGRHKKQSGGHGQFGDVYIRFGPSEAEGLEFVDEVVGGTVPRQFIPSVEKGLLNCIKKGVLAGYPMVGLRAALYFGSSHPVDSSDMAFQMAASIAYKEGIPKAAPTLLEPIGTLKAIIPNDNMGDVMGEVSVRRGRVLGMDPAEDGMQILSAEVPMAEMGDFATFMRQCAQGRGTFTFEFARYEDCPSQVAQKVIEEAKERGEIE